MGMNGADPVSKYNIGKWLGMKMGQSDGPVFMEPGLQTVSLATKTYISNCSSRRS